MKLESLFINKSVKNGCKSRVFKGSSLVDMYAECASLERFSCQESSKMPPQNVVV